MAGRLPACVGDCGTGYAKLGYAGNMEPQFIIPSCIAIKESAKVGNQAEIKWELSGGRLKPKPTDVQVITYHMQ
uniref:Uncharacterized protein n=1 Tax=Balaenoptera musculus TaxID=9771 RepID=A0A8C0CMM7_BALMU